MFYSTISCSGIPYVIEQGIGQVSLMAKAKPNSKILNDPATPQKIKDRILEIEEYKSYFENYFNHNAGKIYSKTTILKEEAVTYLVILSPKDRIEAVKHKFPFVGSFPYLGFFKKESALKFKAKKEKQGLAAYMRPVYAYSTLGHFNDPILSSFFVWDKYDLAETIFHELFHTFLFFKNEVDFNENLATFVGVEMMIEYFFKDDVEGEKRFRNKIDREKKMMKHIVDSATELSMRYKSGGDASQILKDYNEQTFLPKLKEICGDSPCPLMKREWNNATYAAYMTYEKSGEALIKLYQEKGLSLKDFVLWIKDEYAHKKSNESFEEHFFKEN